MPPELSFSTNAESLAIGCVRAHAARGEGALDPHVIEVGINGVRQVQAGRAYDGGLIGASFHTRAALTSCRSSSDGSSLRMSASPISAASARDWAMRLASSGARSPER